MLSKSPGGPHIVILLLHSREDLNPGAFVRAY